MNGYCKYGNQCYNSHDSYQIDDIIEKIGIIDRHIVISSQLLSQALDAKIRTNCQSQYFK